MYNKEKKGAPPGRTLPRSTDDSDMYNRAFPRRNALFFFAGFIGIGEMFVDFFFLFKRTLL